VIATAVSVVEFVAVVFGAMFVIFYAYTRGWQHGAVSDNAGREAKVLNLEFWLQEAIASARRSRDDVERLQRQLNSQDQVYIELTVDDDEGHRQIYSGVALKNSQTGITLPKMMPSPSRELQLRLSTR
jgi:hypothetical protein